ncbi:MAG TPA: nuclear transport factor 2 family protein [Candidatus Krumholzibacteria bacterium]|nr:nuclear transport factor 2 family protein [Candidatus Krumholzibacteria bacterium]
MKRVFVCAAMVFLAAFVVAPASHASDDAEVLKAAAAVDDAFLKAFNSDDAKGMAACYSKDAVLFPPDVLTVTGSTAIMSTFAVMVKTMPGCKLEMTDRHSIVAGDKVISYGTFKMTAPGPDGKPMEMMGRFTDVKAMQDGKWVYIHDHASMPMPAPEGGAH